MIDGQYLLTADSEPFVFVPGYDLPVQSHLKLSAAPAQPNASAPPLVPIPGELPSGEPKALEFWVDNTPPIVKDVVLIETHNIVDDTYTTKVTFTVMEPIVDGSHSELPASDRLAAELLKVYVNDAPFYASPVLDSDGFWITSLLPGNSLGLEDVPNNKRAATAKFKLPY